MIKMQKANLISFSIGTDKYGQTRTNISSKREIEIDIRLKNATENQNINFVDFQ